MAVALVGLGVVTAIVALSAVIISETTYDTWGAALVAIGIVGISVPLFFRIASNDGDDRLRTLYSLALVTHLGASIVQYYVVRVFYSGVADADAYHRNGAVVADGIRSGSFEAVNYGSDATTHLVSIVGWVYAAIGTTRIGGYFVFASMAFWGLFLIDRAFRRAVPDGLHFRFSVLVMFFPTLVFWPSTIGKDAWMILMIGMVSYGISHILGPHPMARGFIWLALGLAGAALVRPHLALILVMSGVLALITRRSSSRAPAASSGWRRSAVAFGALVILVLGMVITVANAERFFGVDSLNASTLEDILDETQDQTDLGSTLSVRPVRTPLDLPLAVVTVLFRPFPWEAPNLLGVVSSLESLALLVILARWAQWSAVRAALRRSPFVVFAATYCVLFIVAFSNVENAGILTRQRAQLIPLVLVFAALAPRADRQRATTVEAGLVSEPAPRPSQ